MSKTNGKTINWEEALETVGGDRDLLIIVLDEAVKELPQMLGDLENALEQKDQPTAHRIAHSIKGAALAIAAEDTEAIAGDIEASAEKGDLDSAGSRVAELKVAVEKVLEEYQRFQNS